MLSCCGRSESIPISTCGVSAFNARDGPFFGWIISDDFTIRVTTCRSFWYGFYSENQKLYDRLKVLRIPESQKANIVLTWWWCHWWRSLFHSIYTPHDAKRRSQNATKLSSLNAIKMRAKSHLFPETPQSAARVNSDQNALSS